MISLNQLALLISSANLTMLETDPSTSFAHPNIAERIYGNSLPIGYSLSASPRRTRLIRNSRRTENWKGDRDTEEFLILVCLTVPELTPTGSANFDLRRGSLLRLRHSSQRAISICSQTRATQPFSSHGSHNNSLPSIPSGLSGQPCQPRLSA